MEQSIIEKIALKRAISIDNVLREYYEYLFLKEIFDSKIGDKIVFKGGTALRIFYSSPRYSDDLDFSMISNFEFELFEVVIKKLEKKYINIKINDLWKKYNTFLFEFKIKEDWKNIPINLKIEISRRQKVNINDTELKLIKNDDFNLEILGRVARLDFILKEKLKAIKDRDEPKDFFDIWYISQLLNKKIDLKTRIDKKRYKQVLNKYLPVKYRKILDEIL